MFVFYQGRYHRSKCTLSQEHFKLIPSPVDAIIHKMFTECFLCANNCAGHSRGHEGEQKIPPAPEELTVSERREWGAEREREKKKRVRERQGEKERERKKKETMDANYTLHCTFL